MSFILCSLNKYQIKVLKPSWWFPVCLQRLVWTNKETIHDLRANESYITTGSYGICKRTIGLVSYGLYENIEIKQFDILGLKRWYLTQTNPSDLICKCFWHKLRRLRHLHDIVLPLCQFRTCDTSKDRLILRSCLIHHDAIPSSGNLLIIRDILTI